MSVSEISPLANKDKDSESPQPWWRYRMLWLVIGGPLAVVVASVGTAVVAIRGADPVLTESEMRASASQQAKDGSLAPALQARNHAASPKP